MDDGMYPSALRMRIKERLCLTPVDEFEQATGISRKVILTALNGGYRCRLDKLFTIMEYLELDTWDNKYKPEKPWQKPKAKPNRHKKPWHMRAIAQP